MRRAQIISGIGLATQIVPIKWHCRYDSFFSAPISPTMSTGLNFKRVGKWNDGVSLRELRGEIT